MPKKKNDDVMHEKKKIKYINFLDWIEKRSLYQNKATRYNTT